MNPFYVAYAKAHGNTGAAQLAHDKTRWPGGKMAGFMLWMSKAWSTWSAAANEVKNGSWSTQQAQDFAAWLGTGYALVPVTSR